MAPPPLRQEKYSDSNPVVRFVLHRFFERVGGALSRLAPRSILDAGCGEGELLRRGTPGGEVRTYALDLGTAAPGGYSGRFVRGSVLALPFADEAFDVAVCLEVLEHLADPAKAVCELARVTRRAVVLSVPHEPYFRIGNMLRGKYLGAFGNYPEHVQHWNPRTFRAFLERSVAGVEVQEALPWIIACCRPR